MPPAFAAFLALVGLAVGWQVPGALVHGPDPSSHFRGASAVQEYRVWNARAARRPREGCAGTTFALATGERRLRLQVDEEEQILGTSWSDSWNLDEGQALERRYVFLDPVDGAELACRVTRTRCEVALGRPATRTVTGVCYDRLPHAGDADRSGPPRLKVLAPHFVSSGYRRVGELWVGGGEVRITVQVLGELTEKWWCPEVEVEWPDETRSKEGADCEPWAATPEQVRASQSWRFAHQLGRGENRILVRLLRAGDVFAAEVVVVTVTG